MNQTTIVNTTSEGRVLILQTQFVRPKMMKNENSELRYIVNGKRLVQELRVETCV